MPNFECLQKRKAAFMLGQAAEALKLVEHLASSGQRGGSVMFGGFSFPLVGRTPVDTNIVGMLSADELPVGDVDRSTPA